MKHVIAFIKPHKLSDVTLALHRVEGLAGMSAADVRGFGRGRARDMPDTFSEGAADFVPRVRIEVVCPGEIVEEAIETIRREVHTGLGGDGKIYVALVEDTVRISTGERGEAAA